MSNVETTERSHTDKNSIVQDTTNWEQISTGLTVFESVEIPIVIRIFEIGSRACKLVVTDVRDLQEGFKWAAFRTIPV